MMIDPSIAGIGLRFAHYEAILESRPPLGFLEIHTENFFGGGYHREVITELSKAYPFSFHCVGLSLGSSEPVDEAHLAQVKALVDEFSPALVSDHASWSRSGNAHLPDLLPLPYNDETLRALADNVNRVQDALGRQMLVENPSTYLQFEESTMDEPEFLSKLCTLTGCSLLLDLNNIIVQAHNHAFDARDYLAKLQDVSVGEMHLAGHIEQEAGGELLKIDTHSEPVPDEVWALYETALAQFGAVPTLIEWDKEIPELPVLLAEADKTNQCLQNTHPEARHAMG